MKTIQTPRGIRNNNPLNLRKTKERVCKFAWAMAYVENGQTLDYHLFTQAWHML